MNEDKYSFCVFREEANFDRACDTAFRMARSCFGISPEGHSTKFPKFARSRDSIRLRFIKYQALGGMGGVDHLYEFEACIEWGE